MARKKETGEADRKIERGNGGGVTEAFRKFAQLIAGAAGSVGAFSLALVIVLCWALTGPLFGFSDTWQLVINTGTTIITFLMVFVIQNTQNRDSRALHAKLDELLIAVRGADNRMVQAEDLSDADLVRLKAYFIDQADSVEQVPDVKPTSTGRKANGTAPTRSKRARP